MPRLGSTHKFSWQEDCLLHKQLFDLRSKRGKWTLVMHAKEYSVNQGDLSRKLKIADALEAVPAIGEEPTFDKAWRLYKRLVERYCDKSKKLEDHHGYNV